MVIITAYGTIERAVEAVKAGASDFITKPFDPEHLAGGQEGVGTGAAPVRSGILRPGTWRTLSAGRREDALMVQTIDEARKSRRRQVDGLCSG